MNYNAPKLNTMRRMLCMKHKNQYLEQTVFNPPDPQKMENALNNIQVMKPAIAIILLAYHAGFGSSEMLALKASSIKDDFSFIEAPDGRRIPVTEQLADEIKGMYWLNRGPETPLIYSRRHDCAMSRMNANKLFREFMTLAGMPEVRLMDLRTACIVNWMQQYPWEYVSQISGVKLSVLTQRYQHYLPENTIRPKTEIIKHTEISPELIEEILQKHTGDQVGLIFRLTIIHHLNYLDLSKLTWDMVDLENERIILADKTLPITKDLLPCIESVRESSKTQWVFAFPNTQTPYTSDTFSYLTKRALLKDGYLGITINQLARTQDYFQYSSVVHALLKEKGRIVVADVCEATNLQSHAVYTLLENMIRAGEINQIGNRFYSSENTVSPDKFIDIVKKLHEQSGGFFTGREFSEEIGIDHRSAVTQLNRLMTEGKVRKSGRETYAYIQNDEDS